MTKRSIFFFVAILFALLTLAAAWGYSSNAPVASDPSTWTTAQLKHYLDTHGIDYASLKLTGRSDYAHLVEEKAADAAAKKEKISDWFNKHKDDAVTGLLTAQQVVKDFLQRVKNDLKARKTITEDQIDATVTALQAQADKVTDWADVKESQGEDVYNAIKKDLDKHTKMTKDDIQYVLDTIKTEFDNTVRDYSSSAKLLVATATISGSSILDYASSVVGDAYSTASSVVSSAASAATSNVADKASSVADQISSSVSSASSVAGKSASSASSVVAKSASSASSVVSKSASSAASVASKSASSIASSISKSASSAYSSASGAAATTASDAYDATNDNVESVLGAIRTRLISTKDWTDEQVNGALAYIKDSLFQARLTTETQVNSVVNGVKEYLSETKTASQEQINHVVKGVQEELEKWRKNLSWYKKEEL